MTVWLIPEGRKPTDDCEAVELELDATNPWAALAKARAEGIDVHCYWLDALGGDPMTGDLWISGYDMATALREQLGRLGSSAEVEVTWEQCLVRWPAVCWSGSLPAALEALLGLEPFEDPELREPAVLHALLAACDEGGGGC